jgi:hypothetical protein
MSDKILKVNSPIYYVQAILFAHPLEPFECCHYPLAIEKLTKV